MSNLDKQLETVKKERDSMKDYLRQLEQKNDDLERAHRILNESIVDFEKMLDKAYEKNALLEMEVDEKEMLQEKLQRLMDETRGTFNISTAFIQNILIYYTLPWQILNKSSMSSQGIRQRMEPQQDQLPIAR